MLEVGKGIRGLRDREVRVMDEIRLGAFVW